jgi:hypothetical protein
LFIINCYGEQIAVDLGEPVRTVAIGLYASEMTTDCPHNAFDLEIESTSIIGDSFNYKETITNDSFNSLSIIFMSSVTNKVGLVQTDSIPIYSKSKAKFNRIQLDYKCRNIYSEVKQFPPRLLQLIDDEKQNINQNETMNDMIHTILYS